MKIDKRIIDNLLALPDEKMWQMVKLLMTANGADVSDKPMDTAAMGKLRALLSAVTESDLERISFLMNIYRSAK